MPQFLSSSFVIEPNRPMLAEILKERGFRTAAVLSQHQFRSGSQRNKRLTPLAAAVRRGFESFDLQSETSVDAHGFSTRDAREVTDRALTWLDANADAEHFFLWLHYFDPHDPYEPPASYREFDRDNRSKRSGDRRSDLQAERLAGVPWRRAGSIFDPEDVRHLVNLYDGEILFADSEIGRFFDALDARGLTSRTAVVLLSDHGEWLGEGNLWDHCLTMNEAELRVPFLVRVAGGELGGRSRVDAPVSTLDLLPTLLGVLGIEAPPGLDGRDLRRDMPDRKVFSAWKQNSTVRSGDWKLLHEQRPTALYRVADDPLETRNRLGEGLPEEAELSAALRKFLGARTELADQNKRLYGRLRALGYVE